MFVLGQNQSPILFDGVTGFQTLVNLVTVID